MLTSADIKKLQSVFPSKADYKGAFKTIGRRFDTADERFDRIETVVVGTQARIVSLESRMDHLEQLIAKIIVSVDKLAKSVDDLLLEYAAIKEQLDRHERWIKQIAQKAGVALVD